MIKIYLVPSRKVTREYLLIKQGLVNNPRVKLVSNEGESDYVFLFYTTLKHKPDFRYKFPADITIFIDYHDKPFMIFDVDCKAYFKRSWVDEVSHGDYSTKRVRQWPSHFHPINFAIMDEFIVGKKEAKKTFSEKREYELTCTLRAHKRHPNRPRVLNIIKKLVEESPLPPSKFAIGEYNQGNMKHFNDENMRDYFNLLRRSKIIVTCNPSRWEGDFRTWEAFASGALIFVDRMYIPMTHPLVDGKHCIFYDVSGEGLMRLEKMMLYFIKHPDLAAHIAREGHDFTMKYHRASNRIDDIFGAIHE